MHAWIQSTAQGIPYSAAVSATHGIKGLQIMQENLLSCAMKSATRVDRVLAPVVLSDLMNESTSLLRSNSRMRPSEKNTRLIPGGLGAVFWAAAAACKLLVKALVDLSIRWLDTWLLVAIVTLMPFETRR